MNLGELNQIFDCMLCEEQRDCRTSKQLGFGGNIFIEGSFLKTINVIQHSIVKLLLPETSSYLLTLIFLFFAVSYLNYNSAFLFFNGPSESFL